MTDVTVSYVAPSRGVCSAWVVTPTGTVHKVGHLPGEGWWCTTCGKGRRCQQIDRVKEVVPVKTIEAGGRAVMAGTTPPDERMSPHG